MAAPRLDWKGFKADKIRAIAHLLPATYAALDEMAPWQKKWPSNVRPMQERRIIEGRQRGAGHGITWVGCSLGTAGCNNIEINPHMTPEGIWLVLIHENLHHAFPDATEDELNNVLVPEIFKRVTGEKMPRKWARKQGLGPPKPGIGDRGYVRG